MMAAINGRSLKRLMKMFQKEHGRGMTVEELRKILRG
jgi:hypothetical protein